MKLAKWFSLLAMIVMVMVCASCASTKKKQGVTTSAVISNARYSWGTYKADVGTSLFMIDKAVRRACARARLNKTDHAYHTSHVDYRFEDIDKVPAEITVRCEEEGTSIKIRIGRWGDEESSQALLVAIDEELKLLLSQPGAAEETVQK